MRKLGRYLLIFMAFCIIAALNPQRAFSRPLRRDRRARMERKISVHRHNNFLKSRPYKYVNTHDLNNDGMVDNKDRLIWLNNKAPSTTVYVSDENNDLVEVMDQDGDGDVETWEAEQFMQTYDTNANGVLEEEEIEAAVD